MSMMMTFWLVPPDRLERLIRTSGASAGGGNRQHEGHVAGSSADASESLIGRLEALFGEDARPEADDEAAGAPSDEPVAADTLDVGKSWHGLHFLLTETAWEGAPPLNFIVAGGADLDDMDNGYGPARAFTSAELRDIGGALERTKIGTLKARFNPTTMAALSIYPDVWDRPGAMLELESLLAVFEELRTFVARGRVEGCGLVVSMT